VFSLFDETWPLLLHDLQISPLAPKLQILSVDLSEVIEAHDLLLFARSRLAVVVVNV
jgi:hypothetical protein